MHSKYDRHEDAVLMATARTARCIGCLPGAPTPDWANRLAQILLENDTTGAIHVSVAMLDGSSPRFECKGFALGGDAPNDTDAQRQMTRLAKAAMGVLPAVLPDTTSPVVWTIGELLNMHKTPPRRHGFLRKKAALLMGFVPLSAGNTKEQTGPLGLLILWDRPGEAAPPTKPDPECSEVLTQPDCVRMLRSLLPMIAHRLELALQGAEHRAPWLSKREHRVLMLLARGLSVPEIAAILNRSPYTIRDYVKSLHRKLGTTSRSLLMARILGQSDMDAQFQPQVMVRPREVVNDQSGEDSVSTVDDGSIQAKQPMEEVVPFLDTLKANDAPVCSSDEPHPIVIYRNASWYSLIDKAGL